MEELKTILENLKESKRRINNEFKQELKELGFKIEKEYYTEIYDHGEQEKIKIGSTNVWLVEEVLTGNKIVLKYKFKKQLLEEITETIKTEAKNLQEEDTTIKEFFNKLK